MSEKMSEVYEAYDMEILGAVRGRGSMILKTDQGIRQISPFDGSESGGCKSCDISYPGA